MSNEKDGGQANEIVQPQKMTHAEWWAEAKKRFGKNQDDWKFVCPSCKHVFSIKDWKDCGAPTGAVAYSCVGRWLGDKNTFGKNGGPCNYTGGAFLTRNPITVDFNDGYQKVFAFAPADAMIAEEAAHASKEGA